MSSIKSRLQKAARQMGYSDRAFCMACGLREDWLNHLGDYVKEIDVQKIFSAFPALNLYYIFLGKSPCSMENPPCPQLHPLSASSSMNTER